MTYKINASKFIGPLGKAAAYVRQKYELADSESAIESFEQEFDVKLSGNDPVLNTSPEIVEFKSVDDFLIFMLKWA